MHTQLAGSSPAHVAGDLLPPTSPRHLQFLLGFAVHFPVKMWNGLKVWLWDSRSHLKSAAYGLGLIAALSGISVFIFNPLFGLLVAVATLGTILVNRRREALSAPRRLHPSKRSRFIYSLLSRRPCTVEVWCILGDSEAEQYANELIAALGKGGWEAIKHPAYNFRGGNTGRLDCCGA